MIFLWVGGSKILEKTVGANDSTLRISDRIGSYPPPSQPSDPNQNPRFSERSPFRAALLRPTPQRRPCQGMVRQPGGVVDGPTTKGPEALLRGEAPRLHLDLLRHLHLHLLLLMRNLEAWHLMR